MNELIEQINERITNLQEEPTDVNIGKVSELHLIKIKLQQLILSDVIVMLPLLEVDRETLAILTDYYKEGEKIEAIKMLMAEVKRTYYTFGIKEAKAFFEGN